MGVASLILGILALIVAWVPCVGIYALGFSVLGLILGAVGISAAKKSGQGKGVSVAGLVCNIIATAIALVWFFLFAKAAETTTDGSITEAVNKISQAAEQSKEAKGRLGDLTKQLDKAVNDASKQVEKAVNDASKQVEKAKADLEKATK